MQRLTSLGPGAGGSGIVSILMSRGPWYRADLIFPAVLGRFEIGKSAGSDVLSGKIGVFAAFHRAGDRSRKYAVIASEGLFLLGIFSSIIYSVTVDVLVSIPRCICCTFIP